MKTILMMYLIVFKGYSVIRIKSEFKYEKWNACNSELGFDYSHSGSWGTGSTPQNAVLNCYKNVKLNV